LREELVAAFCSTERPVELPRLEITLLDVQFTIFRPGAILFW
jgi:hypothetical protein